MKTQMMLVLSLLSAFAAFEGASRLVAQETGPTRRRALNPSQAFPTMNPSQAIPPVNPSETVPPANPSRTIPPVNPSEAVPPIGPSRTVPEAPPVESGPVGGPRAVVPSTLPLTTQVFIAIAQGPAGIPVRGLRVATDRGSVVLTGSVATEADRALAAVRAEEFAGRGRVVNNLTVSP